jgi:hypothetical protein
MFVSNSTVHAFQKVITLLNSGEFYQPKIFNHLNGELYSNIHE